VVTLERIDEAKIPRYSQEMRIALAQINPRLGDFAYNAKKILTFTERALEKRAHLVVFSETALFGYPAYDSLERVDIVEKQERELQKLIKLLPAGITCIFGAVIKNKLFKKNGKPYQNVAVVARRGSKTQFTAKQLLPSYDVFDDTRFFEPGKKTLVVSIPQVGKVAVTICEDMWNQKYAVNPLANIKGVDLVVNISASPYSMTKLKQRLKTAREHVKKMRAPFLYVNQVGGQDEIIFDGSSFILGKEGKEIVQAASCEEDLVISDLKIQRSEHRPSVSNNLERLRLALTLGLRDFMSKTNQKSVHLGLSGGIDSALVAAIAVDALGANNVTGFLLPGPYSSEDSIGDATALARNLKIKTQTININKLYELIKSETFEALQSSLHGPGHTDGLAKKVISIVDQNIQSRLRGLLMMTFSNASQSMLLTTTNKSEMATGYGTLYGDLCGGLAPIGDLVKSDVYKLARHYNFEQELIPENIFSKAPSAELAPNQKDQDNLPPYDKLDKAVKHTIESCQKPIGEVDLILQGLLLKSEWKRWQTPPVLRVTERAFGKNRRWPIAFKI
jgi:NAD+ synthase (glutamine-hydrolysing)